MSGILLKLASVGNKLQLSVASYDNNAGRFYFDANGFVGGSYSL